MVNLSIYNKVLSTLQWWLIITSWSIFAGKFILYLVFIFLTLMYFTFYGMMAIGLTPTQHLGSVISSAFYSLWNLLSGFLIPKPVSKGSVWSQLAPMFPFYCIVLLLIKLDIFFMLAPSWLVALVLLLMPSGMDSPWCHHLTIRWCGDNGGWPRFWRHGKGVPAGVSRLRSWHDWHLSSSSCCLLPLVLYRLCPFNQDSQLSKTLRVLPEFNKDLTSIRDSLNRQNGDDCAWQFLNNAIGFSNSYRFNCQPMRFSDTYEDTRNTLRL